jgi:hypothetical protein
MKANGIFVELQWINGPGAVKARADVRIQVDGGSFTVFGFSIIEKDGKAPWIGFPQKQGKIPGKYFPVFEAEGNIRTEIIDAILEAYRSRKAA